jgi:hypothetical protein
MGSSVPPASRNRHRQPLEPTPTPRIDPKIDFKVSLVGNRHEFSMGKIIPIKLAFSSRVKDRY